MAAGPFWREYHQNAASVTGDGFATDQPACLDPVHQAGHPASGEERPLLELLHAELVVRHRVADYPAWRRVYDSFAPTQKVLGVTADAVYQAADDPNDLTVSHDFATIEAAKAFLGSAELHGVMASAGVEGQPTVWFTSR